MARSTTQTFPRSVTKSIPSRKHSRLRDKIIDQLILRVFSLRNISAPESVQSGITHLTGMISLAEVAQLDAIKGNVRIYHGDVDKKRNKRSSVNRDIQDTLERMPELFSLRSGGITFTASSYHMDEKTKDLSLEDVILSNGAQTQGVIRDVYRKFDAMADEEESEFLNTLGQYHVRYELIVTDDVELRDNIAITRNTQNPVKPLSIAGAQGALEALEKRLRISLENPSLQIQKSETDWGDEYLATEQVLKVCAALMPAELYGTVNKCSTYSEKAKHLRMFVKGFLDHEEGLDSEDAGRYRFFLDAAPIAYELHETWKSHQGFKNTGLHCLTRDATGSIESVPDGLIFPVLAAHSIFMVPPTSGRKRSKWTLEVPAILKDERLIRTVKKAYMEIAKSDPTKMGKSSGCYAMVMDVAEMAQEMSE